MTTYSKTHNYKTVLCEKWKSFGKCPYNHLCMFAHGSEELLSPGEYDSKKKQKRRPFRKRDSDRESNLSNSVMSEPRRSNSESDLIEYNHCQCRSSILFLILVVNLQHQL